MHWKLSAMFKHTYPPLVPPSLLCKVSIPTCESPPTHALKQWFIISMHLHNLTALLAACNVCWLSKSWYTYFTTIPQLSASWNFPVLATKHHLFVGVTAMCQGTPLDATVSQSLANCGSWQLQIPFSSPKMIPTSNVWPWKIFQTHRILSMQQSRSCTSTNPTFSIKDCWRHEEHVGPKWVVTKWSTSKFSAISHLLFLKLQNFLCFRSIDSH